MRRGSRLSTWLVGVALLASAGCGGGADFRYLESDDGHVFAKIPDEWEVVREGGVAWRYLVDDNLNQAYVGDDSTLPWRAEFRHGRTDGTAPLGYVEAQHLDARVRSGFLLSQFLDQQMDVLGAEAVERRKVAVGDAEGYRVTYTIGEGDDLRSFDEVHLVDDRRSAIYSISIGCTADCQEEYATVIDEVLTTFWVEL